MIYHFFSFELRILNLIPSDTATRWVFTSNDVCTANFAAALREDVLRGHGPTATFGKSHCMCKGHSLRRQRLGTWMFPDPDNNQRAASVHAYGIMQVGEHRVCILFPSGHPARHAHFENVTLCVVIFNVFVMILEMQQTNWIRSRPFRVRAQFGGVAPGPLVFTIGSELLVQVACLLI